MADDIVTRLRHHDHDWLPTVHTPCDYCDALAEIERLRDKEQDLRMYLEQDACKIERLRAALALAVGELSTHGEYTAWTPEMLMNQFLEEARRG